LIAKYELSKRIFQGGEQDYVILSLTKSNDDFDIGFMTDPALVNVAITRCRKGLIIVGNPETFSQNGMWNQLMSWYVEKHLMVSWNIFTNQFTEYTPPNEHRFAPRFAQFVERTYVFA